MIKTNVEIAKMFEVLRGLNEVKQDEDCMKMLKAGSFANVLSAVSLKKKHMKTASQSKGEQERIVVVKRLREGKAKDVIEFLKMLENI